MRFLYSTDLHGDPRKYDEALRYAVDRGISLIHLGGDLLPKGKNVLKAQKKFVKGFLHRFYDECEAKGIKVLAFFGNDDLYCRKKYFREYAELLDEHPFEIGGYQFTGYPFVPDYRWLWKFGCKNDRPDWYCPELYLEGTPKDCTEEGLVPIEDIGRYFESKGTIEGDLRGMPGGDSVIAAIHCPPDGCNLDVCQTKDGKNQRRVGSRAVTNWILEKQPRLVLCGHIHESPFVNDIHRWSIDIDKSLVIQPGQFNEDEGTVLVDIDVTDSTIHINRIELPPR